MVSSLFPPVLWKSCSQIPLTFNIRFPEDSQSLHQLPGWGSGADVGISTFTTVGELLGITVLQFVGHPPGGDGIWFYHDCPLLPPHCGFSFILGCGVPFFDGFQNPPVNVCSTASCGFGALTGRNECMSLQLTILNQIFFFFFFLNQGLMNF